MKNQDDRLEEFDKQYYKIRDVAELLGVPSSTLRYWETEFPEVSPKRSHTNQRYYRPDDIRKLRMIHYLVKVKGLKLEAAKEELRTNKNNISRKIRVIDLLTETRDELQGILDGLTKRKS